MNNFSKSTRPVIAVLAATLLASCGANSGTVRISTDAINAVYMSVAQTMAAQYLTGATQSTADQNIASLSTDTPAELASPSNLPLSALNPDGTSACDNSIYISDVTIPDNTVVNAGQTFTKTWIFRNVGSCTWDANYTLTFISGDQMNGVNTTMDTTVLPGAQAALSVTLAAPTTAGTYIGYWQLANDAGAPFGAQVYVIIDVTQDATATATVTP